MLIDTVPDLLILRWICGRPAMTDSGWGISFSAKTNPIRKVRWRPLSLSERWHTGCAATAEEILERAEDKKSLGEKTGCLAGDLETARIVEVCAQFGVPVLSVRCISDAVEDDLPVPAQILVDARTGRPNPLCAFSLSDPASGCRKRLQQALEKCENRSIRAGRGA